MQQKKTVKRIDIIFCTDKYLLELNKNHLKHDWYTDTITFLFSNSNESIVGEVYISIERVYANSKKYAEAYGLELVRVIIHGCLHLCGYLDTSQPKARNMIKLQEKYLNQWIVSRETKLGCEDPNK